MIDLSQWSLPAIIALFLAATVVIAIGGTLITGLADRLADYTGLGEAFMGALFLGGATSLPGIVTSVTAAAEGHPDLAVSNALGGIAAQTAFLGVADLAYRKANLEHAAASMANLTQGTLLVALLAIPLLAMGGPRMEWLGIHPASVMIVVGYAFGLHLISRAHQEPMWHPRKTPETRMDEPTSPPLQGSLSGLWLQFAGLALILGLAGYVVTQTGIALSQQTGLSETIVGGLFTAISTSMPELVIAVAAVRRGALTLAVGDILGGNCFDVIFVAFADVAYREGSIYHAMASHHVLIFALPILLTGILLLGLLHREKHGMANIGFESVLVLVLYLGVFSILIWSG